MGYLAIIGFPRFSGFWSKDKIIETALADELAGRPAGPAGRRRHRLLHDPADADDLLHREALEARRAPARVAQGDDDPADRARRAVGGLRRCSCSATGSSTGCPRWSATPRTTTRPSRRSSVTLLAVLVVAGGVALAWFLVGKREVPLTPPEDVSFATRAARNDLYGDAINDTLVVRPGAALTRALVRIDGTGVDGVMAGGPAQVGGIAGFLRRRPERLRPHLRPVPPRRRPPRRHGPPGGEPLMGEFPWLTVLIAVPLVGAVVAPFLPKTNPVLVKQVGVAVAVLTLAVGVAIAAQYDVDGGMQLTETHTWIEAFGVHYALGVDGLGLLLILLTALLVPIVLVGRLARGRRAARGVRRLDARPRGPLARGLRRHRRVPVLRRLRGDADPGVLPHRRLRPRRPLGRRAEVPDVPARRRPGAARRRSSACTSSPPTRAPRRTCSRTSRSSTSPPRRADGSSPGSSSRSR